jgi:hypothetical protein
VSTRPGRTAPGPGELLTATSDGRLQIRDRATLQVTWEHDLSPMRPHAGAPPAPAGPMFLEVGARFGGADVVDTFELSTSLHMPFRFLQMFTANVNTGPEAQPGATGAHYGWFVWPGHQLGGNYCRISNEKEFRESRLVWRWTQRHEGEPIKTMLSYTDTDIPLAGIVGPADSAELERLFRDLFTSVQVELAAAGEL